MIPREIRDYAQAMNRGDFFLAHEILEEPWKTPGDRLYRDDGIRALIFVAASALHASRGNPRGAISTAAKALLRLEPGPGDVHGILVTPLLPLLREAARSGTFPCFQVEVSGEERGGGL